MTALATPAVRSSVSPRGLTFGGQLRSAWISQRSLRGTTVSLIVGTVVAVVGAVGLSLIFNMLRDEPAAIPTSWSMTVVGGALVVQIIGLLVGISAMSKDDSTGALKTITAAAPRRASTLFARTIIVAATTFVWSLVSFVLAGAASAVMFLILDLPLEVTDATHTVVLPVILASVLVSLTSVLGIAIATLLRSENWSAMLGVTLIVVLPLILRPIPLEVLNTMNEYVFGTTMAAFQASPTVFNSEALVDMAITVAWPAVALIGAAFALRSRDV